MNPTQWCGCGLVGLLVVLTGCETTQATGPRTAGASQSIRIESSDLDAVYAAGMDVMAAEFARLESSPRDRVITIEPEEYQTRSESGTARDFLGGVSQMRRTAWFRVDPVGSAARARVRVDLQRLDTRRGELQRRSAMRLDDNPGYTPIQEDAATTQAQNTLWTSAGRDRALERRLLLELREQIEGVPITPEPAASADESPAQEAAPAGATSVGTLEPVE